MNTFAERPYSSLLPITFGAFPAVLVTALLFLLMHNLIDTDMVPADEPPARIANIVRPDTDPPEVFITQPATKPVDASPPPEWVEPLIELKPGATDMGESFVAPIPSGGKDIKIVDGGGGIVAYLKPQPMYPSRALTRGIEGHVDLAFDIIATGSTTNIRVINADPEGVFERAAINALKKWRYKVPVIDDVPQGQVDMMTRMTFELEI